MLPHLTERVDRAGSRKGWLRPLVWLLLAAVVFGWSGPAAAQQYRFGVPELRMQVYVQPDASARIVYDIAFANSPSAGAIEIIDIGMPDDNYDLGNMSAEIDGRALTDIRVSEFVDPGVEVHLGSAAIRPGEVGTLHFEFTMPGMVYQDTTREDYASLQVTPTWFDPTSVTGAGDIWVLVHMLPEVTPDEVLYQDVPYTDLVTFEEHAVAVWHWPDAQATRPYLVGVSFPQRGMVAVVDQSLAELATEWLLDNPTARLVLGLISFVLVGFAFFRFTGGTGLSVFAALACGLIWWLAASPTAALLTLPLAVVLVPLAEYGRSRRKPRYLPALAQVEGGGIKRGLTAPEAAVLLELPLNRILGLVIFGLLEKGVLKMVADSPLAVEVMPEYAAGDRPKDERRKHRQQVAQKLGVVLRAYEHPFLDAFEAAPAEPVHRLDLSAAVKRLIEHSAARIKGFDLSDTQDYYRRIIARAVKEARAIGDIPERERFLDRHMQWILLDDNYPTVFVAPDYQYRPVWVRPFTSSDRLGIPSPSGSAGPSLPGTTTFANVAASFAGWAENTMGRLTSAIAPGKLNVDAPRGVVNLSGADRVTGDIFKALSEGSRSGGGSSGSGSSCACACAGCACACACAGGGR